MNSGAFASAMLNDALVVDEVGIEIGVCGKHRLRSFYEPIFERGRGQLHMVAAEGSVLTFLSGRAVAYAEFLAAQSGDHSDLELLRRVLQVRNHGNIGIEGIELHLDLALPPQIERFRLSRDMAIIAQHIDDVGLDPRMVVCTLYARPHEDQRWLVKNLRGLGLRIAIGDFGAANWTEELLDDIRPDIVRVDEAWFTQICSYDATVRLFKTAVAQLRERPARVLVKGIDTPGKLHIALETGVTLFQGSVIAGRAPIGAAFDEEPPHLAELLGHYEAMAPYFG